MSKMKKTILGFIAGLATMATASISSAVSGGNGAILFPYINSNPGNVSTIVTVITETKAAAAAANSLHFRYWTKPITAPLGQCCLERNFTRPTTNKDIVTFDVAGHLAAGNQGRALFNDATNYNAGAGAPRFDLPNMGMPEPRRGYLLVAQSNALGTVEYYTGTTDGEAMLIDIPNGAAWSYRAFWNGSSNNAITPDGYGGSIYSDNGTSPTSREAQRAYSFNGASSGSVDEVAFVTAGFVQVDALYEDDPQPVAIYPPNEFTTNFFITPLNNGTGPGTFAGTDLRNGDAIVVSGLFYTPDPNSVAFGVFDRNENPVSGGQWVGVCCVGSVTLADYAGNPNWWGSWFLPQGGWAYIRLEDASRSGTTVSRAANSAVLYNAFVFKLQFGANSTISPGKMINAADLIKSFRGDYFTNRP